MTVQRRTERWEPSTSNHVNVNDLHYSLPHAGLDGNVCESCPNCGEQRPSQPSDAKALLNEKRVTMLLEILTPEERALLHALYYRGVSLEAYGDRIGKYATQVLRERDRILNKLREHAEHER